MRYTNNYNFNKPELTDDPDPRDFNENFDVIDEQMKENEDKSNENETELSNHINDKNNPHDTDKEKIGLGNVDNVQQATKREFDNHVANKGKANGYASLDSNGNVPEGQLGNLPDNLETTQGAQEKANRAEQNANQYTSERINELDTGVTEVNGRTGKVKLNKNDVDLGNVDNVQQASKTELEEHTEQQVHQGETHGFRINNDGELEFYDGAEWKYTDYRLIDDFSDSPGPKILVGGDSDAGYFGTVPYTDLVSGDALAETLGISTGTSQHSTVDWLKFYSNGKIIFTTMKPIRYSISWDDIDAANAVYGNETVEINGLTYRVRLWKGAQNDPSHDEDSDSDAIGSEWNKLMLPIHEKAPSSFAYSQNVDEPTKDWGVNFTDGDLLTDNSGNGYYSWCQEALGSNTSNRVIRGGFSGVSYSNWRTSSTSSTGRGWRPVLELV